MANITMAVAPATFTVTTHPVRLYQCFPDRESILAAARALQAAEDDVCPELVELVARLRRTRPKLGGVVRLLDCMARRGAAPWGDVMALVFGKAARRSPDTLRDVIYQANVVCRKAGIPTRLAYGGIGPQRIVARVDSPSRKSKSGAKSDARRA